MNKYYDTVMGILEQHSGYTEAEILGGRAETCADMRSILVALLQRKYANYEVVAMTGLSRQSVSRIAAQHHDRVLHKYSMAMEMREVERELSAMTDC
jgi:hypothetical protein